MTNPRYSELETKKDKIEFIKQKLSTDDRWIARGLFVIYSYQTASERKKAITTKNNGVGFHALDAEFLTSLCEWMGVQGCRTAMRDLSRPFTLSRYLSPKQIAVLKKKMPKYATQLYNHSEGVL